MKLLTLLEILQEKGGNIGEDVIFGAGKFHQNHILKWIYQKYPRASDTIAGLCSSVKYNNVEGVILLLEYNLKVNGVHDGCSLNSNIIDHFIMRHKVIQIK